MRLCTLGHMHDNNGDRRRLAREASWRTCVPSVDRPSPGRRSCQGPANEVSPVASCRVTARSIESSLPLSGMPLARGSRRPKHQAEARCDRTCISLAAPEQKQSADTSCTAVSVISFSMRLTRPHSSRGACHGACRRQPLSPGSQTMHRSPAETRRRIHGTRLDEEMKELNDSSPPTACGQRESLMT